MAKRKGEKTSAAAPAPPVDADVTSSGWWPREFLAPVPSAIIVAAGVLTSILIAYLTFENGLVGTKQFLAYVVGLGNPYDLGQGASSRDVGAVLLGFIWVVVAAAIHPAGGIAVLALLRPWLDGYTFPTDNMYFVWGIVLCFVIWGARTVMHGGEVRAWKPALLFACFPLVAFALSGHSINYNETFRALILWPSYVILFFLIANMGAKPVIFRFLVGVIAVSIVAEAVFAVMQYRYILPYLRMLIQRDPSILRDLFGVENPTPELARRFQINRAFGTVLFPNALAAFLITWIPLFAAAAWNNLQVWRRLSALPIRPGARTSAQHYDAAGLAVSAWFVAFLVIYGLFQFPVTYLPESEVPGYLGTYASMGVSGGLALLPAAGLFLLALSRGPRFALTVTRASLYALALLISLYSLGITFSRGGILGLLVGSGIAIALLFAPAAKILPRVPRFLKHAVVSTAAVTLMLFLAAQAPQPNTPPASPAPAAPAKDLAFNPKLSATQSPPSGAGPTTEITTGGQNVALGDLTSGASFKARFTYWKVALRMLEDNFVTGVGLKCFGWAYPKYQYLGAFDVREAHNGFLQAYCETGLLGGTALLLFWVYIVLYGAVRVLEEADPPKRLLYAAITAGLTGFLFHTAMDINFSHPTLMFFVCVLAGFLFAIGPPPQPSRIAQVAILPALLVATLCAGVGLRVFAQDLAIGRISLVNVSNDKDMELRLSVGRYFLETVIDRTLQKQRPPAIFFASARLFITDTKVVSNLGPIFAKGPDGKMHQIHNGEVIPDDALMAVNKPWVSRNYALEAADRVTHEVESIDAHFPYNPKIASYLAQWYRLMMRAANTPDHQEAMAKYQERMMFWTEEAHRRNPWHAGLIESVGNAYWDKAQMPNNKNNQADYEKALDEMKTAAALAPVTPSYWGDAGAAAKLLTEAYEKAGLKDKAAEFRKEEQKFRDYSGELITQRIQLGVDPPNDSPPAAPTEGNTK